MFVRFLLCLVMLTVTFTSFELMAQEKSGIRLVEWIQAYANGSVYVGLNRGLDVPIESCSGKTTVRVAAPDDSELAADGVSRIHRTLLAAKLAQAEIEVWVSSRGSSDICYVELVTLR